MIAGDRQTDTGLDLLTARAPLAGSIANREFRMTPLGGVPAGKAQDSRRLANRQSGDWRSPGANGGAGWKTTPGKIPLSGGSTGTARCPRWLFAIYFCAAMEFAVNRPPG